ncbi:MAG: hypothetical protein GX580_17850 [Candidatus Hydrogenedens sp.]|nr:hypothetical protein [Candidatus Hydrogenedentota bacterium]NLF59493.1 hypothetical protein [Candidatus Hydrogenedens sp.]
MTKPAIARRPAPAQDIFTILDIILYFLNVIESLYRVFTTIFGSTTA